MNDSSGFDLRKFQEGGDEHESVKKIVGKIISGREGYEIVSDKTKPIPKCPECGKNLINGEKFCPECGAEADEK